MELGVSLAVASSIAAVATTTAVLAIDCYQRRYWRRAYGIGQQQMRQQHEEPPSKQQQQKRSAWRAQRPTGKYAQGPARRPGPPASSPSRDLPTHGVLQMPSGPGGGSRLTMAPRRTIGARGEGASEESIGANQGVNMSEYI